MKDALKTCRACNGTLGEVFYSAQSVPVHSCLLLENAAKAEAFPKGDVQLAACLDCGTITNLMFDKRWSAYSPKYEDQQAFSATFNSFAGRLAQDLVTRHGLAGETVIDVGCSKGDFLALLCDAGVARGIGIDPSVLPGRVAPRHRGQLDFIEAYYSEAHLELPAKLISNRHTLEHVHDVHHMLRLMHRHATRAGDAVVFIEVPSMTRILRDYAFEDIYYEHCSYFTPGALGRALRTAGFGVKRIWLGYDDQYLMAEAVVDPSEDQTSPIEEDVDEVLGLVASFQRSVSQTIETWRERVERAKLSGHRIAIWGSGSKCIAFWHALGSTSDFASIVDINPNRWSRFPPSLPRVISNPTDLATTKPDLVIAMNAIYKDEIVRDLDALGLHPRVIALGE